MNHQGVCHHGHVLTRPVRQSTVACLQFRIVSDFVWNLWISYMKPMDLTATPSKSRYEQVPKPEAGLAEWTSRIKAMQRQVDADEEAEQRKLEEEIAASRLARIRRSKGLGYGSRISTELGQSSL